MGAETPHPGRTPVETPTSDPHSTDGPTERQAWIAYVRAERQYLKHTSFPSFDRRRADELLATANARRDVLVRFGVDPDVFR